MVKHVLRSLAMAATSRPISLAGAGLTDIAGRSSGLFAARADGRTHGGPGCR